MRQFKLKNAVGQEYDLTDKAHFLYNVSELGFEYDADYKQVGVQFIKISEKLKQPKPKGTIKFNEYEEYSRFVIFTQKKPLVLIYIPENKEYRLDCEIYRLEKAEKEKCGWLRCKVEFKGLGSWYKYTVMEKSASDYGKTYNYIYPYNYTDNASDTLEITSESTVKSPVILNFIGPCKNPSWKHYVNGIEKASGKVVATLKNGERLNVSSVLPYRIIKTDNSGNEIEDLYGLSDFSTKRFLFIEQGENRITITHEGVEDLNAIVEVYEYYESV